MKSRQVTKNYNYIKFTLYKVRNNTHPLLTPLHQSSWSLSLGVGALGRDIYSRARHGSYTLSTADTQTNSITSFKVPGLTEGKQRAAFYSTCPSILKALADTRGLPLRTQASFTR